MGKVAVRVPVRGWRLVARLLVVVLAGAVAFAPGVTGTEAALAGPMFSHPVFTGQGETHPVSTGHGDKNSGDRRWGAHPVASLREARTALKKRWQARLTTWSRPRAERILAELDKRGTALMVKSGWFRSTWLLVSKDKHGLVRITRKGQLGGPKGQAEDQVLAHSLQPDEAREALAGQLNLIPRISRVWSQAERFAEPIEALEQPGTTSVVITETSGGGAKDPLMLWRTEKSKTVKNEKGEHVAVTHVAVTLARLDDHGIPVVTSKDLNLSIEEVITRLSEHFGVGSVAVSVQTQKSTPAQQKLKDVPSLKETKVSAAKDGQSPDSMGSMGEVAAEKLWSARPSWRGGAFLEGYKGDVLASVFRYGRRAYVEVAVPIGVSYLHPDIANDPRKKNDPSQRQAQGIAQYGIENLGGGQLRITDVGDGGREIAHGYLHRYEHTDPAKTYEHSDPVYKWFNEMLAHVRYAHKPGTGQDLARLEDAFPHQSTALTPSPTVAFPSSELRGMLLPADGQLPLTREAKLLIQDRLLQGKSINLGELLNGVDLEQAFAREFKGISVRALAEEAGKITGTRVLGIARARDDSGDLFTVAAVDGQLAFYDQDRNLRDHVADLLTDSRVDLLRTTGQETHVTLPAPTGFAQLTLHTWTPVTHDTSLRLVESLGVDQTIDIIRTADFGTTLHPEILRITGTGLVNAEYQIYKIRDRDWMDISRSRSTIQGSPLARPYTSSLLGDVFVRRVDPHDAPLIPGVEERHIPTDRPPSHTLPEAVNPYRAWEPAPARYHR